MKSTHAEGHRLFKRAMLLFGLIILLYSFLFLYEVYGNVPAESGGEVCSVDMTLLAKYEYEAGEGFVFEKGAYPDAITIFNVQHKPGEEDEPIAADFTSTQPVSSLFVKAGPEIKMVDYVPAVIQGMFTNDGLQGKAISFVAFCQAATPETADLEIDLQVSPETPDLGEVVTVTLQLFNNPFNGGAFGDPYVGDPWQNPTSGRLVDVKVYLPPEFVYVAGSATGGDAQQGTDAEVMFTVNELGVGVSRTLTLQAQTVAPVPCLADVMTEVFASLTFDPDACPCNIEPTGPHEDDEAMAEVVLLPVELIAFKAIADGERIVLTWRTAAETNNAGFEVWHTPPGAKQTVIAFLEGHGTTNQVHEYRLVLDTQTPGVHRFQLKQVDFNGMFAFGPVVEVRVKAEEAISLSEAYPNPCNPKTHFTLTVAHAQPMRVEVFDMLGRRIATLYDGWLEAETRHLFTFEVENVPSGLYVYRATGEHGAAEQSFLVVQRGSCDPL